ncbi:MAG: hypothetical protein R6X13_01680 [bacterium]
MTKLHFAYKDIFRALRLGFSAKKVWMMSAGLLVGLGVYALLTYVAYLASGSDLLLVWQTFRLLPFPLPDYYFFPWYSWVIYGLGVLNLLVTFLVTGTAVSKVAYEGLRGDEFFEAREAFRFALRNLAGTIFSPVLILAFVALLVAGGLVISLLGMIPFVGELVVGLFAIIAFFASLFIVYLLAVFAAALAMSPSVVGATRADTFDTLFEVFSCVNEQPARLVWYTATVAVLAKFGSSVLGLAASLAGRVGYAVLGAFAGTRFVDTFTNAGFYFKIALPDWWPAILQQWFAWELELLGLPQVLFPADYLSVSWAGDIGSLLVGLCFYAVALMVLAYGFTVWFSGMTLTYAVLAHKKDDKNVLEIPEDEEELIEPVVKPEGMEPPVTEPDQ